MTETGTGTYTTETGVWGYTSSGTLFCSTCGGAQEVPCPATDRRDPKWGSCYHCDAFVDEGDPHGTITCPTCEH